MGTITAMFKPLNYRFNHSSAVLFLSDNRRFIKFKVCTFDVITRKEISHKFSVWDRRRKSHFVLDFINHQKNRILLASRSKTRCEWSWFQ